MSLPSNTEGKMNATSLIQPNSAVTVDYDSSVASTSTVNGPFIELLASTNCWVTFGAAPVAVAKAADSFYLAANVVRRFRFATGYKIAAIKAASAGFLNIISGD